ncbi:hypothetical protein Tco_0527388 [Tanacetum coccineum]
MSTRLLSATGDRLEGGKSLCWVPFKWLLGRIQGVINKSNWTRMTIGKRQPFTQVKVSIALQRCLLAKQTSHSPVQTLLGRYGEGDFVGHAAEKRPSRSSSIIIATSHASRTPTRGGVDNIFIRDAWGN